MVYDILWNEDVVGRARVTKKGLYYEICCRDGISMPHCIEVRSHIERTSLGICVPIQNEFGFCTRIPVKRIGDGVLTFHLIPINRDETFVVIKPDEPFPHISRLKNAYLFRGGNELGLKFRSGSQDRLDSGQNRKYQSR